MRVVRDDGSDPTWDELPESQTKQQLEALRVRHLDTLEKRANAIRAQKRSGGLQYFSGRSGRLDKTDLGK